MSLDINSPLGQNSLAQEQKLLRALEASFPNITIVQTIKRSPADVDGFGLKNGYIVFLFESKCRNLTRERLRNQFDDEWLLTFDKLMDGAEISKRLCIPFYGFLYLISDDKGLAIKLTDSNGQLQPQIRLERTETQRTINGGLITRTNAYVKVTNAKEFLV